MFDETSRYYNLTVRTLTRADGTAVRYAGRRFLPNPTTMPLLVELLTAEGDRLDLITARTLGDPLQFWRICDANTAMDPLELFAETGTVLKIPVPQVQT